jgi:SAM-dependent methyltransferase
MLDTRSADGGTGLAVHGERVRALTSRLVRAAYERAASIYYAAVGTCFDALTGMETTRRVWQSELGYAPDSESEPYVPVGLPMLRRMLRFCPVSSEDVFIDFGSGKGRAVLWAARYPFKRVIGVEWSDQLNQIARSNLERNRHRLACKDVEFVTANAAEYAVPDDLTVAFFNNPFKGETFRQVVDHLCASLATHPRPFRIIYGNPVMRGYLIQQGFREARIGRALCMYSRPRSDSGPRA